MAKEVAKPRSIKITDTMWSAWQAKAKAEGVSVAAFIIGRAAGVLPSPAIVVTASADQLASLQEDLAQAKADIEGFRAARDTYIDKINRADAEIADLKKRLAAPSPKRWNGSSKPAEPKKGSIADLPGVKALPVFRG